MADNNPVEDDSTPSSEVKIPKTEQELIAAGQLSVLLAINDRLPRLLAQEGYVELRAAGATKGVPTIEESLRILLDDLQKFYNQTNALIMRLKKGEQLPEKNFGNNNDPLRVVDFTNKTDEQNSSS